MAVLEFKPKEKEPKKSEKMSIIELLDQMAEQMLEFVAHYYDDFLIDGVYQAIFSKQECFLFSQENTVRQTYHLHLDANALRGNTEKYH